MSDVTSGESSSDSDFSEYVSSPEKESTEIDSDVPLSVLLRGGESLRPPYRPLSSGRRRIAC